MERPTYKAKRGETLTIEEARRLLKSARGDRYEAVYVLAVTAGLRLGEILGLKWTDIDFKRRTLSVQRSLLEVSGATELVETKTQTSRRLVALGTLAIDGLKRRQEAWKKSNIDPSSCSLRLAEPNSGAATYVPTRSNRY